MTIFALIGRSAITGLVLVKRASGSQVTDLLTGQPPAGSSKADERAQMIWPVVLGDGVVNRLPEVEMGIEMATPDSRIV